MSSDQVKRLAPGSSPLEQYIARQTGGGESASVTGKFDQFTDFLDPADLFNQNRQSGENSGGFSQQLKKFGDPNYQPPEDPNKTPEVKNARLTAFDSLAQSLKRKRAMSTLFTGGQGTLDSSNTSQSTMLSGS